MADSKPPEDEWFKLEFSLRLPWPKQKHRPARKPKEDLPPGLEGFNWGAALVPVLWGLGNGVYWVVVTAIVLPTLFGAVCIAALGPVGWVLYAGLTLFLFNYYGLKGNEWAWQYRDSGVTVKDFRGLQRGWAVFATVLVIVGIPMALLAVIWRGGLPPSETVYMTQTDTTSLPTGSETYYRPVIGRMGYSEVAPYTQYQGGQYPVTPLPVDTPATATVGPNDRKGAGDQYRVPDESDTQDKSASLSGSTVAASQPSAQAAASQSVEFGVSEAGAPLNSPDISSEMPSDSGSH